MQNIVVFVLATCALALAAEEKAPRFSIGLGVLAPSYSQKFAGNGRLDFDQDKNGFSYTLNNVPHTGSGSSDSFQSQSNPKQYQSASSQPSTSGSDYAQPQSQFSIYQHRQTPKHSEGPTYHSAAASEGDYTEHDSQSPGGHYQSQPQYQSQQGFSSQGDHDDGSYRPDTNSYGDDGSYKPDPNESSYSSDDESRGSAPAVGGQQNQPHLAAFNFEQNIQHQFQDQPQGFHSQSYQQNDNQPQSQPQSYQSSGYESQPSQPQSYQSQPSQFRSISLQPQPTRQHQTLRHRPQQHQYNPHKTHKQTLRV